MSEWKKVKLGEISLNIQTGPFGSQLHQSDYVDTGVPVIMPKDIINGKICDDTIARISSDLSCKLLKYQVEFEDIIYPRRGDISKCAIVDKSQIGWLCGTGCLKISIDKSLAKSKFIYYELQLPKQIGWIINHAIGATMLNLNTNILQNVPIDLPSINTQNRIAEILSRYDSLIENYQKQIKLLEELAQRLYKEWFVDLRFPGHENTKIVDGVPEGWEKKKAQDFFKMSIGKTPPRVEKKWFTENEDSIPWVSISDMKDKIFISYTSEKLTKEACDKFNVKIIPVGTVILSFKLTVGRVAITSIPMCTNEAIAHFSKEGNNWRAYTFYYLKNYNYDSLGNTSGISKAVNSTIIKNMPFLVPSKNILYSFEEHVNSYFARINNISTQIEKLIEARDRLLPKLMSGEIEV